MVSVQKHKGFKLAALFAAVSMTLQPLMPPSEQARDMAALHKLAISIRQNPFGPQERYETFKKLVEKLGDRPETLAAVTASGYCVHVPQAPLSRGSGGATALLPTRPKRKGLIIS